MAALAVVPAGTQDRDCLEALSGGKAAWPSLRVALLDGPFAVHLMDGATNAVRFLSYDIDRLVPALTTGG